MEFENKPYVLLHSSQNDRIKVLLKDNASISDSCIEALIAAGVYRKILSLSSWRRTIKKSTDDHGEIDHFLKRAMKFSNKVACSLTEEFKRLLKRCDYDLNRINVVPPSISCIHNISIVLSSDEAHIRQ